MDLLEKLQQLASKIEKSIEAIQNEEATKQAFVIPFIIALGYDVYDPFEVKPEFTADIGTKKGEKVDYAIIQDEKPIILMECKWCGNDLDHSHTSQLYRYFSATEARLAILTNGTTYQFFTDLEKPNTMDEKPFLEFNILHIDEALVPEIKKFSKPNFDLDSIISSASELKYTREINSILVKEIKEPSDEFTKFFASKIYSGRMTQNVLKEFKGIVKRSLDNFIKSEINTRLKSIIDTTESSNTQEQHTQNHTVISVLDISSNMSKNQRDDDKIETTDDEIKGFLIIVGILKNIIDKDRIIWKDVESYFNVILDDNMRKPICRLHFNSSQKYISLFDQKETRSEKIPISEIDDIKNYASRLIATITAYETQ